MSTEICGHDRDHLRWALNMKSTVESGHIPFTMGGRLAGDDRKNDVFGAVCNPDKLAEIVAELLRKCTSREVVIFSPVPGTGGIVAGRTPSRLDYVVYWDRDHGGIQIKPPRNPDDPDMSKVFTMQQARAFLLKLLDSPSEQDIERMLRVP